MGSINEHVQLVQLLYIRLDLRQFLLVALLASLETGGVDQSNVSDLLVISINLIPSSLQTLTNLPNLLLREALSASKRSYLSSLFLACKFWIILY